MNRSPYGERDYAFGQAMLTLRTSIGLTQAGLADLLHVSRRAVGEWEAGSSYPTADHLKRLIMLGVQQQAFPAGREAEEIRALWKAAHQKVLLDELWLAELLSQQRPPPPFATPQPIKQTIACDQAVAQSAGGPRVDWGDALAVPTFYGRELGLGGIGKSTLVVSLMHQLAPHFEVVLGTPLPRARVLEAVEALRRRSLVERGHRRGSFTLQSVVLEYATARLIAEGASEIEQGRLARLIEHGLELATAREYVRQTQTRLIVAPILANLRSAFPQRTALEE